MVNNDFILHSQLLLGKLQPVDCRAKNKPWLLTYYYEIEYRKTGILETVFMVFSILCKILSINLTPLD